MDMIVGRCKKKNLAPVYYGIPKDIACPDTVDENETAVLAVAGFERQAPDASISGYYLLTIH